MTTAHMAWTELAEKGADIDVLRQIVQFMDQRQMGLDVKAHCGAGCDEKSLEQMNSRNGYRKPTWDTRAGSVELRIPKLRQGSSFPEFLEPRRAAEKALTAVIQEAYAHSVSTRSANDLVKALRMSGVSRSKVGRLCAGLVERVSAFLSRQIEGDWPYLWIGATQVKTREAGRIVSVAVVVAMGVNTDGQREVLGLKVRASEAEPFWTEFPRSLPRLESTSAVRTGEASRRTWCLAARCLAKGLHTSPVTNPMTRSGRTTEADPTVESSLSRRSRRVGMPSMSKNAMSPRSQVAWAVGATIAPSWRLSDTERQAFRVECIRRQRRRLRAALRSGGKVC